MLRNQFAVGRPSRGVTIKAFHFAVLDWRGLLDALKLDHLLFALSRGMPGCEFGAIVSRDGDRLSLFEHFGTRATQVSNPKGCAFVDFTSSSF